MIEITEERICIIADLKTHTSTEELLQQLEVIRNSCEAKEVDLAENPETAIEILGILKAISVRKKPVDFGDSLVTWLTEFVRKRKGTMENAGRPISIW